MPRVLLIAYYFPPLGLGGVGRPLNLFRHLPDFGWDCHVLTVKSIAYRAYEPELLEGLDQKKIFRSGSRDPQRLMRILGVRQVKPERISGATQAKQMFFPDSKSGWVRPAVKYGRVLCENYEYDAIITTSPPISSHLIGKKLAQEFELPWVADYRDYWGVYQIGETYEKDGHRRKAEKLRLEIAEKATELTGVCDAVVEYAGGGTAIPNGYLAELAPLWRKAPDHELFQIGLLGHIHDDRRPDCLLGLLGEIRKARGTLDGTGIIQVGQMDPDWFKSLLNEAGLEIPVEFHGPQPRDKAFEIMSRASAFVYEVSAKEHPGILPSKVFDYLVSGRVIVAFAPPEGDIFQVINDSGQGKCFALEQYGEAASYFNERLNEFQQGMLTPKPLSEYSQQFSSIRLAEHFAELLGRIT